MSDGPGFQSYPELLTYITNVPPDVAICGIVFGSILDILILASNIFVIWAIIRDVRMRNGGNVYLVSMALSELLTLPIRDATVLMTYVHGRWEFGGRWLAANFSMDSMRGLLALEHVFVITFVRYIMVVHSRHRRLVTKTWFIVVTLIVVYALPLIVVASFLSEYDEHDLVMNTKMMKMNILIDVANYRLADSAPSASNATDVWWVLHPDDLDDVSLIYIAFIVLYAFLGLVPVGFYIHTYSFLRRHSNQMARWSTNTDRPQKPSSHDVKFIKTVFLSFVVYLCSFIWIPVCGIVDQYGSISYWAYLPFVLLYWSFSFNNWVIFIASNAYFRQNLRKVFGCRSGKVSAQPTTVTTQ